MRESGDNLITNLNYTPGDKTPIAGLDAIYGPSGSAEADKPKLIQVAQLLPEFNNDQAAKVTPYPGAGKPGLPPAQDKIGNGANKYPPGFGPSENTIQNTRAAENVLPKNMRVTEVSPDVAQRVAKWELVADGDLSKPRSEYLGRNLLPRSETTPGSSQNPGHAYAFGFDAKGRPVVAVDYTINAKQDSYNYKRQWQFNYGTDTMGNHQIDVNQFVARNQTSEFGQQVNINGIANVKVGTTRFHEWSSAAFPGQKDNTLARVEQFDGMDAVNPQQILDVAGGQLITKRLRADGQYDQQKFAPGDPADRQIKFVAPKFYFFNLYGL